VVVILGGIYLTTALHGPRSFPVKKIIIGICIIALIVVGGYLLLRPTAAPASGTASPTATASGPIKESRQIVANAKVLPMHSVELRFPSSGTIAELLVKEGDSVAKDAPLARLESRDLELKVAAANAALARAQSSYDQLRAGATPAEIAAARAQVDQAQAQLRQTAGNVTQQDIAAARAKVEEARANLAQIEAGSRRTDIVSAQATLDEARANLQTQRDSLSAAKTRAQSEMEQAANRLRDRQADYDRIYKVTRIETIGQSQQGDITYKVYITPDKQDQRLRWNMTASVSIDTP
jgi:HlyD family secretion protein